MNGPSSLAGKTVLITGGSSGIGRRLALDMAAGGATVVIASHDPARLRVVEDELRAVRADALSVVCDVARDDDVTRMADDVLKRLGHIDILVNNAGYAVYRTFVDTDLSEVCRLAEVNLVGVMRCTRVFLPAMVARRSGVIVNMASIAGRVPLTPNAVYGASKHGLVALSEALRYELAPFSIRVHVVCPGRAPDTSFFEHETFRTRMPRAETRYTVGVADISRATLKAIASGRFMTYVPRALGLVAWTVNALPWLAKPVLGRLMAARVRSYYAAAAAGHDA